MGNTTLFPPLGGICAGPCCANADGTNAIAAAAAARNFIIFIHSDKSETESAANICLLQRDDARKAPRELFRIKQLWASFTEPSRGDDVEIQVKYLQAGDPLSDGGLMDVARPVIIANEQEGGHYLPLGDSVRYDYNYLGDVEVQVVTETR